jgi:hypothetical protein
MEEKIYQAIVKGLGKTSLSERTLNAKAARLAKKITKDEELTDEVVQDAVEDLKETEGQLNHEIAEKEKALDEKRQKEKKEKEGPKEKPDDEPPSWFKKTQEEQNARLEKIEKDAQAYQQDKQRKELRETIQQKAKKLGIPEFAYLKFNPEKIEDIDAGLAEIQAGMVKSGLKPTSIPEGGGGESDPFADAVKEGTEAIKASAKK